MFKLSVVVAAILVVASFADDCADKHPSYCENGLKNSASFCDISGNAKWCKSTCGFCDQAVCADKYPDYCSMGADDASFCTIAGNTDSCAATCGAC